MRRIVVVGGSIAAATAASTLRMEGFDGEITVVSAETTPPYSRVPLSKGILAGTEDEDSALLPELPGDVHFRGGSAATRLDVPMRLVHLADGERLHYDGLIVATGARAHRLASAGQNGELVLRDLEDANLLRERASRSGTAIVVGGGFLAMELASTLCGLGIEVTVVAMRRPLSAHLGDWLSSFICEQATSRWSQDHDFRGASKTRR